MAGKLFSIEELNFFKFACIVLNEFAKALREIFTSMWDNKIASTCRQRWDDSVAVRNIFQSFEGGCTKIAFSKSFQEWDCTALFQATIYAQTFALTGSKGKKTLDVMYLRKTKPAPGSFHSSVNSASGDQNETLALAIDQLRLLRNAFCHSAESKLDKTTFDQYMKLTKDAFAVAKVNTASIDDIGNLAEEDFPTSKVNELKAKVCDFTERAEAIDDRLIDVKQEMIDVKHEMIDVKLEVQELSKTTSMIQEKFKLDKIRSDLTQDEDNCSISGMTISSPRSYLPPLVPYFTGRVSECENIIAKLSSGSARLLNIFGSPGFGKTSTAIAAGHALQSQGNSVYFSTFRGITSKHDFVSKLLSLFRRSRTSDFNVNSAPCDELIELLNEIPCRILIILDDLDDLLACINPVGATSLKDEILHFIEGILGHCPNVCFLTTTRQCLQFMSLKLNGCQSIRIGPLDQHACESLIRKLLPSVASDVLVKITQICGNVPLAIKLLCFSNNEVKHASSLHSFFESSEGVLDLLDKREYPSDLRLKVLFQSSFNQLSQQEKEVFSSLSIFDGSDFDVDAAIAVVGGDKAVARQNITSLVSKSLIDTSAEKRISLHPLLHSFAIEKGGDKLKEATLALKTRLYNYYVFLFQTLNEQFLSGKAMVAFSRFYQEEHYIWLSFCAAFQDEELSEKMFDILSTAEMFLNALYLKDQDSIEFLYDLASRKVLEQGNDVSYHRIVVSRCCRNIFNLGRNDNIGNFEKVYSLPGGIGAKCMCYQGIYALSNGLMEQGILLTKNGISILSNSSDHRFLKLLTSQLISLYYKFSPNSEKSHRFCQIALNMCQDIGDSSLFVIGEIETDEETEAGEIEHICPNAFSPNNGTSPNKPLVVWVCSLLSLWTREYLSVDMKMKLNNIVLEMQRQVLETTQSCDNTLASLRYIGDYAVFFLNPADEATRMYEAIVNTAVEQGEKGEKNKTEDKDTEAKKLETDAHTIDKERLATWFFRIGQYHYIKGDNDVAAQSHERALVIRRELYGDKHVKTAESYQLLGNALSKMRKFAVALHQYKCALDIRLESFGEQHHGKVADICESIGILQYKMGKNTCALESHRRALTVRLDLYGQNHAKVAKSYRFVGGIEEALEDFTSAYQSYSNALKISLQWYGKNDVKIFDIYLLIGNIQTNMADYSSALHTYCCALAIMLDFHSVPHPLQMGYLYKRIGILQYNLGDFESALQSHLQALDRLKLYSRNDSAIAECYQNIGIVQYSMGMFAKALLSHQHALDTRVKLPDSEENAAATANCYHNIGIVKDRMGNHTSAINSHQHGLNIRKQRYGKVHSNTACSYHLIGITQNNKGNYASALESYKRELDIKLRLQNHGENNAETAVSYQSIGITHNHMGEHTMALHSHQRALEIILQMFGEHHARTADIYQYIGSTYNNLRDYDSALRVLKLVLDIKLKLYGENIVIAGCHYNIGIVQCNKGDLNASVQSYQCELDTTLKFYGENHAKTADSYHHVGSAQNNMGNYQSAVELLQRSLHIRKELCDEQDHALISSTYRNIGIVLRNMHKFESALYNFQQALDIRLVCFGEQHMKTTESNRDVLETKAIIEKRKLDCVIM